MGERDVFPMVGRNTKIRIPGARGSVYPLVTGTFGGVDFLHSVTGEVSDKMIQSEIQDLENTLQENSRKDTSMLRDLLDKIPSSLFGGDDKKAKLDELENNSAAAQMETTTVSPRDPEEFTRYIGQVFAQLKPAIEFHDDLLKQVSQAMSNIPVLGKIIEQLEEQLSLFVFQQIAPFVIPVIDQVKNELATGSTEIIEQSKNEQHNVFHDDDCSNPTHSMLSKDHFSNILNEIAGHTASKVVSWVVPQIMDCWDDDRADVDRVLSSIIFGVLHHPAQREGADRATNEGRAIIFRSIEEWWSNMPENAKNEYREKLSRRGTENGQNHKEGVHDTGHGCGGKLSMHKNYGGEKKTLEDKIADAAVGAIMGQVKSGFGRAQSQVSSQVSSQFGGGSNTSYGGGSSGGGSGAFGAAMGAGALGGLGGGYLASQSDSYRSGETDEYGSRSGGGYSQESSYGYEERSETRYGGHQEQQEESYSGYSRREEPEEEPQERYGGYSRREEREEEPEERYEEPQQQEEEESGGGFLGDIARRAREAFDERQNEESGGSRWGF